MLYIADFLGYTNTNEYGLFTYSNGYRISFIENVVGKINWFYDFIKFKGELLMEFYSWNVENAIYMKNFNVLSINNLISQETGSLNFNSE